MRSLIVPAIFGLVLLSIAIVVRTGVLARKDPGRPINAAMREALSRTEPYWTEQEDEQIDMNYHGFHETKGGTRYVLRQPGTGDAVPQPGQTVSVAYKLSLLDGTVIEDTAGKAPLQFRLGSESMIPGFEEGVAKMHRGEKRTLIVPWWQGYGEQGKGPIPPRAVLVFDVEMLDFH